MHATNLKEIARWCGGSVSAECENVCVSGLCHDSREVVAGDLFFALQGANDGHAYVEKAREMGAAAAVVTHAVDADIPVVIVEDTSRALVEIATQYKATLPAATVAITGSVGKTTTRSMTSCLMRRKYNTAETIKNYNNDIGLPVTIGRIDYDAEMIVLEMGMNHFGEMSLLTSIGRPDTVLITNIGSMHIENLGSREGILKAKLEILEGLREGGTAVFNGDEPLLWNLRDKTQCKVLYYGCENENCQVRAINIELNENGSRFDVIGLGDPFAVSLNVPGRHNVHNALAAITVACLYDVPHEEIQKALSEFENTSQRQQTIKAKGVTIIDDTYNAGPESMEAALRVLGDTKTEGKRIAVLGDMLELGNHSNSEHYKVGRIAAYKADLLLTYGPLSESAVSGAITGGMKLRNAMNFKTHDELLNVLRSRTKAGDVILFKGSHGMHMEKILQKFIEEE